ncbi:MAG: hypothetical protein OXT70_10775 [Chloroflexota bacterium]|nr:hypothetical protein [Chloroflexota bacterium]
MSCGADGRRGLEARSGAAVDVQDLDAGDVAIRTSTAVTRRTGDRPGNRDFFAPQHGDRGDERAGNGAGVRQDTTRQHQNDMWPGPRVRHRSGRSSRRRQARQEGPKNGKREAKVGSHLITCSEGWAET